MMPEFIDFDVFHVRREAVLGIAKNNVPATYTTQEYFAILVYVTGLNEPVIIPFNDAESRDKKYDEVKGLL